MTDEDFETYLKSIGGLVNGYYSDRPPIIARGFCTCGPGWLGLIKQLIDNLIKDGWNKEICQVKEKFGGLRFYTNELSDAGHQLVKNAESMSYKICEECGEPGKTRGRGWVQTLCDKCELEKSTL